MPALPSYLQGNPAASAQNYLARLPGMFNASGLQSAYNTQNQVNFDQGRALAAAAANQYTQRARQSGASTLGAGFAQASAMIPVYQQQFAAQSDLQNKLLQYKTQQAQIGAGLTGDIGRLQAGQQSTYQDYLLNQQKLQQQGQQFGAQFVQQNSQFDQDYRLRQLALFSQLQQQQQGKYGGANPYAYSPTDRPGYVTNSGPLQDQIVGGVQRFNTASGGGGATNGANFYLNSRPASYY